jgi:paraquat-inducible protein B
MSKPAGKTLIGIFVLGAISLLVIAIVMLGSEKFFRNTDKAVCFFEGSVGGLSVGAPVVFNGVRIGSVTDIVLRYDTSDLKTTIPVTIEIDPKLVETVGPLRRSFEEDLKPLINQGLRARLELQSILTGMLEVGLGYYPDTPVRLAGDNQKYPEIPTIPSQEIMKRIEKLPLEEIAKNVEAAVEGINRLVNSPEIMQTVRSISQAADETRQLAHDLDAKSGPVLSALEGAVGDARKLIRNTDGQIGPVATSLNGTLASIKKASDEAGATFRQAQQTLTVLEGDIGEDSELMYELEKTIKEVGGAGKAIQSLTNTIERQPESLLFGKKQK